MTMETINFTAPAEPEVGSVVIDKEGAAWQSRATDAGNRWSAPTSFMSRDWAHLVVGGAPLTLVYTTSKTGEGQ